MSSYSVGLCVKTFINFIICVSSIFTKQNVSGSRLKGAHNYGSANGISTYANTRLCFRVLKCSCLSV